MRLRGSKLHSAPQFGRPVGGLSSERLGFNPGPVHVGFVMNKVALGQVTRRVFRFSPVSVSFHSFTHLLSALGIILETGSVVK
jgi:hypothetical protein